MKKDILQKKVKLNRWFWFLPFFLFLLLFLSTEVYIDEQVEQATRESTQRYGAFIQLDEILKETSSLQYDRETYNCVDFSQNLQAKLADLNIKSNLVVGKAGNNPHMWVALWVEPTTGKFVQVNEDYLEIKEIDDYIAQFTSDRKK